MKIWGSWKSGCRESDQMQEKMNGELTGTQLKVIALVTMIIDHIGLVLLEPNSVAYWVARSIGRLAFPIYCFLLVEGFVHTRNVKKYLGRLLLFAVISEIPFDMIHDRFCLASPWSWQAFVGNLVDSQNVFFTLAIGVVALWGYVRLNNQRQPMLAIAWCVAMCGLAWLLRVDYSYGGVALICIFYRFRQEPEMRAAWGAGTLLLAMDPMEWPAFLDFWLFSLYRGKKGNGRFQWLFYAAYPLHLLALWMIARSMKGIG